MFLDGTNILKQYYSNTGCALPGSTILTVSTCTADILLISLIIIVVLFGSLRNFLRSKGNALNCVLIGLIKGMSQPIHKLNFTWKVYEKDCGILTI